MADLKGLKRICMSCGARFYDLNKKPIICPNCAVEFTGEIKVKARRGRLTPDDAVDDQVEADVVAEEVEEDTEEVEREDNVVSLEEVEVDADEDKDDIDLEDGLDIDDDLDDDLDDDDIDEDIAEDEEDK